MTPRQSATLAKMLAEYNNRPGQSPDNVPLTLDEFTAMELAALVDAQADRLCPNDVPTGDWLQRWTPAEQEAAFGRLLGLGRNATAAEVKTEVGNFIRLTVIQQEQAAAVAAASATAIAGVTDPGQPT